MVEDSEQRILNRYDEVAGIYDAFATKMQNLCLDIVRDLGIRAVSVTSRRKERESLHAKLRRPNKDYSELEDVTDVVGVRITTYFADDVDKIAERIAQEFDVDWKNSTNRRETLDPDRFGYLSWHHVVSLGSNRASLAEYSGFKGIKVEIQTRSILQHAWAEIEHDLGYKTREGVPEEYRRRFSRLAGLLELADQEFEGIRDGLAEYERDVPERIKTEPELVDIDKASLLAFVMNDPLVEELDREIASYAGATINSGLRSVENILESEVKKLRFLQVRTIQELATVLKENRTLVSAFAAQFFDQPDVKKATVLHKGIALFYLAYVLVAKTSNKQVAEEFVDISGIVSEEFDPGEERRKDHE